MRRWAWKKTEKLHASNGVALDFIPRYQLAIARDQAIPFKPYCVFHFADETTARYMYDKIAQAIIQDGILGKPLAKLIKAIDGCVEMASCQWNGHLALRKSPEKRR